MTNQAAQTMPELPDPAFVTPDDNLYTVHQMRAYARAALAAPRQERPHPDALQDGTLSKSTAKRVTALAAASASERARELLAAQFTQNDTRREALLLGRNVGDPAIRRALRAIEQALTQQRGEVDWLAFADELEAFRPRGELGALHGAGMAFAYKDVAKTIRAKLTATPQPSADAVRDGIRSLLCRVHPGSEAAPWVVRELESLLSGGPHA